MGYDNTRCDGCGLDQHSDHFRQCQCGCHYCVFECLKAQRKKYGRPLDGDDLDDAYSLWRCDKCNPHLADRKERDKRVAAVEGLLQTLEAADEIKHVEKTVEIAKASRDRQNKLDDQAEAKEMDDRAKGIFRPAEKSRDAEDDTDDDDEDYDPDDDEEDDEDEDDEEEDEGEDE